MYAMAQQFGVPTTYKLFHPKTMTWKPMQRLHDLMQHGLTIQPPDRSQKPLRADVSDENDRGDALFWRISLSELTDDSVEPDVFL